MLQPFCSKIRPGFFRPHIDAGVILGEGTFTPDLYRAGQVDFFLIHDHLDAGMGHFVGLEDLLAFPFLVDGVFFGDLHGAHHFLGLFIHQEDFLADLDAVGLALVGGQGDGDGPEDAVGQGHFVGAGTFPLGLIHEAFQGSEAADA